MLCLSTSYVISSIGQMLVYASSFVLGLAHVEDTLVHTSVPVFSVNMALLCFLLAQADVLRILSFTIDPVLSQSCRP